MEISEINFYGGEVIFWDLNLIDTSKKISEQLLEFKEDMLFIKYPNNICLDLGWAPSFKENGEFTLLIVNDSDWEKPLEEFHCGRFI
jgi:hypothetical protein